MRRIMKHPICCGSLFSLRRTLPGLAMAGLFAFAFVGAAHAQQAPKPPGKQARYEYAVRNARFNNPILENMLNDYGSKGWELVQLERGIAIFRRPLP